MSLVTSPRSIYRPVVLAGGFYVAALLGSIALDLALHSWDDLTFVTSPRALAIQSGLLIVPAILVGLVARREQRVARELAQRQAEIAERLQLLYEDSPVATFVWDTASGQILSANLAAQTLFGYGATADSLAGHSVYDIRPPSEADHLRQAVEQAGAGANAGVFTHQRRDGSTFEARIFSHPIKFQGQPGRLVFAHDVTETVRMESALHRADLRLREIVDAIQEGFVVLGDANQVLFANRPGADFLGLDAPVPLVRCGTATGAPVVTDAVAELATAVRSAGDSRRQELQRPGSDRVFDVQAFPVRDGIALVLAEVTAQRRLQRDLERTRDHALAAVRAKSEFLAVMSHEFRTPLNSVLGFSELLQSTPLDGEQQEFVMMVRSNGRLLLELIEEILDYSKMEAGKYQLAFAPFALRSALDEARHRVESLAMQKGLLVRLQVDLDVPDGLVGDEYSAFKIITNLLGNAIKFTHDGEVVVRVALAPEPPVGVEPSPGPEDLNGDGHRVWVRFSVRDTGIGIPAEARAYLFQPFVQVNTSNQRRYGGTGLGLAICQRLATQMGGRIWLGETDGPGSTFHVELPFLTVDFVEPDAPEPVDRGLEGFASRHPLRILIAEDVTSNQRLLTEMLRRLGYDPEIALDGEDALCCLRAQAWDLVLMDQAMPKSTGAEVLAAWRADPGPFPADAWVTAVTATVGDGAREHFLRLGFDDYLPKPIARDALLDTCRVAHERRVQTPRV